MKTAVLEARFLLVATLTCCAGAVVAQGRSPSSLVRWTLDEVRRFEELPARPTPSTVAD